MSAEATDNATASKKEQKKQTKPIINTDEDIILMENHPLSNRTILQFAFKPDTQNRPEISLTTDDPMLSNRTILADASDILRNKDTDLTSCPCKAIQTTETRIRKEDKCIKMKYENEKIKPYFLEYLNEERNTFFDEIKEYFSSIEFITDFYSKYKSNFKQIEGYEEKSRNLPLCPSNLIYCKDEIPKGLFATPIEAYALTLDDTETSRNLHDDSSHSTSGDECSLPLESKCSSDDDNESQSTMKNEQSNTSCPIASADVDPELKVLLQEIVYGSNKKEGSCTQVSCEKSINPDLKSDGNFTDVNTGDRIIIKCNSTCCKLRKVIQPTKSNAFLIEPRCNDEDYSEPCDKSKNSDYSALYTKLERNHRNTMKVIKAAASDLVEYFSWPSSNESSLGRTFQKIIANPEQCRRQLFESKKQDSCGTKIMVESEDRFGCDSPPAFRDPSLESLPQSPCKPRCIAYPPNDDDPIPIKESLQNFYNALYEASSSFIEEGKRFLGLESEEDKDPLRKIQRSAEKIAKEVSKTAEEFKNMSPDKKAAVIKMGADTVVEKVKNKTENILKEINHYKPPEYHSGKQKERDVFKTNSRGGIEKVNPHKGAVYEEPDEPPECYDCSVTNSMSALFNSLLGKDEKDSSNQSTSAQSASKSSPKEVAMNSEGTSDGPSLSIMETITSVTDKVFTYFFDDESSSEDTISTHSTQDSTSEPDAEADAPSRYRIYTGNEP